jgi:O-antigen ligase
MFITGGRGGQLAFFITLFILLIIQKNKKLLFLIPFPVIIFWLAYYFSPIFHSRILLAINDITKIIEHFNFCSSWGIRAIAWIFSWDILKEHYFGVGFNGYLPYFQEFIKTHHNFRCSISPLTKHLHNQYLAMLVEGGIIYLFLYLYMLFTLFKTKIKDNFISILKYIFLINFTILSFVEPIFYQSWSMYLFTFFSGIILAQHRIESLSP